MKEMKENVIRCSSVVRFNISSCFYFIFFNLQMELRCALFWCFIGERNVSVYCVLRLGCYIWSTSPVWCQGRILLNHRGSINWTELKKKSFLKQIICSLQLGNAMLSKEQGSSNKQKGRCNKIIDILLTIYWLDFFNWLFYLYLFKINFEYSDIVMYISANKVNITHSYIPQWGSTSPSTAGQEETSRPPSWPQTGATHEWNGAGLIGLQEANGEDHSPPQKKDLTVSPKASLPPWQMFALKARVHSDFSKTPCTRKNKIKWTSNKQNKINAWPPLRTFGYYKDLSFFF